MFYIIIIKIKKRTPFKIIIELEGWHILHNSQIVPWCTYFHCCFSCCYKK